MRDALANRTSTRRESRSARRQRSSLMTNLRQRPDARGVLRQEQARLHKQAQRLRHHRLWLQLQVKLDRVLRDRDFA